jgi:type VI secretion system secreted protein VgrG
MQSAAGKGWGNLYIPRVGQEVVVSFLEGDPDRPLVTGLVYNAEQVPAYSLPDEKTKSYIKTNSSLGGSGFNEIRFEDKKGEEQLFIHAEKNQDVRTEDESAEWVGSDRHLIVNRHQFEKVEKNKHLTVKGDQNEKIDGTVSLQTGIDLQEKVGMNRAIDAGMEIHLKAGMNLVLEAGMSITLKAGGGTVVVGPTGVAVTGTTVMINSGGAAGSGSGSSPADPELPREADTAESGEKSSGTPPSAPLTQHARAFKNASRLGLPFCQV